MEYVRFFAIDYLLFVFMFGLSCIVGIYFGCCGNQSTTDEYFLGGKRMKVFPIAMSLVASTLSGIGLISIPAEVYMHGTQISVMVFAVFTMGILNNYLYMPVFHKLQLSTVNDYLEIRFDRTTKLIASFLYLMTCILFLPLVIYAPSLAFTQGIQLHLIAPIMSTICIFYTTIGGLRAVVWTDTLQFSITLCTLAIVLVMGIFSVGGLKIIWETSNVGNRLEFFNMDPDPTQRNTFWAVYVGNVFAWLGFVAINPSGVQRFTSVPHLQDAKKASIIFTIFASLAKLISCFSGLIVYTKYHGCDPLLAGYIKKIDQIIPYYVTDVAAQIPGISGLFVAGLFSTAMSTLSTHLNTVSGVLFLDFIRPNLHQEISERTSSSIIKLLTVLIGMINVGMIFVADKLGSLFELFHCAQAVTGGPVLGLFTLGMLFPCANRKGALAGVVCSLALISAIIIKTQVHVWHGDIRYSPRPLGTELCNKTNRLDFTYQNTSTSTTPSSIDDEKETVFWLFRISFHYYYLIGTVFTIIFGILGSLITRKKNDPGVNPKLISPCLVRLLSLPQYGATKDLTLNTVQYDFRDMDGLD